MLSMKTSLVNCQNIDLVLWRSIAMPPVEKGSSIRSPSSEPKLKTSCGTSQSQEYAGRPIGWMLLRKALRACQGTQTVRSAIADSCQAGWKKCGTQYLSCDYRLVIQPSGSMCPCRQKICLKMVKLFIVLFFGSWWSTFLILCIAAIL